MNKFILPEKIFVCLLLSLLLSLFLFYLPNKEFGSSSSPNYLNYGFSSEETEYSDERRDYFFRLTRDPISNKIPNNLRFRELSHAKRISEEYRTKTAKLDEEIIITEAGPYDVGGRTRALGVDVRNSDIIIAGGASGGMWKSINGGDSWFSTSGYGEDVGITSLVQDPLKLDTWYYSTGEYKGTTKARGGGGELFGSGIYKSIDNGNSWNQVNSTKDDDTYFNSQFDFISRVEVSDSSGTMFFASNGYGIYRSTDGFITNSLVLGGEKQHKHSDVQVTSEGLVIALLSQRDLISGVNSDNTPGVYISVDDGINWLNITPDGYPEYTGRGVIGTSESNPHIFYVFIADTYGGYWPKLFKFDISDLDNIHSDDLSESISQNKTPYLGLQGGYNMMIEVHPLDPDFVLLGGTDLYRTQNGFSSSPTILDSRAGSPVYTFPDLRKYNINHHADQHAAVFDPNKPNRLLSAHDGGISLTSDISAEPVLWQSLNNGYNVTQFYSVSLHPAAGDQRVIGGAQDNGSPFFTFSALDRAHGAINLSGGDGGYAYFGENFIISSSQYGRLRMYKYNYNGAITENRPIFISPENAKKRLFIHPFIVNRLNEDIVFFPSENILFRNNIARSISGNLYSDRTSEGWSELTQFSSPTESIISALALSTYNPSDVLYYASYSENGIPQIFRLTNSSTTEKTSDWKNISISNANSDVVPPPGAYIHSIVVNEDDGNEVIVVISNYNTESVYYSEDGGTKWEAVGGNLEPNNGNGPSVRTAAITKTNTGEKTYYVGTTTGLYATNILKGADTEWKIQGKSVIGNNIVEQLHYRSSDKTLAIATHGRGIFLGDVAYSVSNDDMPESTNPENFILHQNYPNPFNPTTNIDYSLPVNSLVSIMVYDLNGRKIADLLSSRFQTPGIHTVRFTATNLASGVYLYKIEAHSLSGRPLFSRTKKLTLIK